MPAAFTIRRWRAANPSFAVQVYEARRAGHKALADLVRAECRANLELLGRGQAARILRRRRHELDRANPKPLE